MAGASASAIEAGRAVVRFTADDSSLRNSLQIMSVELKTWGSRISNMGRSMMIAGAAGASLFIKPIMEAARTEQLMQRFSAVFDTAAAKAAGFADKLGASINKSGLEIRDMMAQFQVMLKGVGMDNEAATKMSQQLTQLTNDWIAFDDTIVNAQEAMDLMRSAMAGETEPARRMGVDLRVATMNAQFAAQGIKNASLTLSEMDRMQWRFGEILRALTRSGVVGQAEREVNTLASRLRGVKAALRDFFNAVGNQLLPTFSEWTKSTIDLIKRFEQLMSHGSSLIPTVAEMTIKVTLAGAAFLALGKAVSMTGNAFAALKLKMLIANPYTGVPLAIGAAFVAMATAMKVAEDGIVETQNAFGRLFDILKQGGGMAAQAIAVRDWAGAWDAVAVSAKLFWTQLKLDFGWARDILQFIENQVLWYRELASVLLTLIDRFTAAYNAARKFTNLVIGAGLQSAAALNPVAGAILDKYLFTDHLQQQSLIRRERETKELEKQRDEYQKILDLQKKSQAVEARSREMYAEDRAAAIKQMEDEDKAAWNLVMHGPGNPLRAFFGGSDPLGLDPTRKMGILERAVRPEFDHLKNKWTPVATKAWEYSRDLFGQFTRGELHPMGRWEWEDTKERHKWETIIRESRKGGVLGTLENAIWRMFLPKSEFKSMWSTRTGFSSGGFGPDFQFGQSMDVQKEQLVTQKKIKDLLFAIGERDGALIAGLF